MPASASIADDWQDVPDDNFSVVSLPTSEEGSDDTTKYPEPHHAADFDDVPDGPESPVVVDKPALPPPYTATSVKDAPHTKEVAAAGSGLLDKRDEVERYGMDTKDVVASRVIDSHVDPLFLRNLVTSLLRLLESVTGDLMYRRSSNPSPPPETSKLREQFAKLHGRLTDLQPIMDGYSKAPNPQKANVESFLDPGLYEWLSSLRKNLLTLHGKILYHKRSAAASAAASVPPSTAKEGMAPYIDLITAYAGQITSFLPVMQADYDQFLRGELRKPVAGSSHAIRWSNTPAQCPPGNSLFHLRRELYNLKDGLTACLAEIRAYCRIASSGHDECTLAVMTGQYTGMKMRLETILSNHTSDWAEYSQNGGMTYAEFCRLDLDTIRSVTVELKETAASLVAARTRHRGARYLNDPDNFLDEERSCIDAAHVDSLRSIQDRLDSMLHLKRQPPSRQASEAEVRRDFDRMTLEDQYSKTMESIAAN